MKLRVESQGELVAEAEADEFGYLSLFGTRTHVLTDPEVYRGDFLSHFGRGNLHELVVEVEGEVIATALCHIPDVLMACALAWSATAPPIIRAAARVIAIACAKRSCADWDGTLSGSGRRTGFPIRRGPPTGSFARSSGSRRSTLEIRTTSCSGEGRQ